MRSSPPMCAPWGIPGSDIRFHYGPGQEQYLTVRASDQGLRVTAAGGWLTITPQSTNVVTVIGSVK